MFADRIIPAAGAPAIAMACAAAIAGGAGASVTIVDIGWQFYQGGLVHFADGSYIVHQDHYDDSPPLNVVSVNGPAAMESSAAMEIAYRTTSRHQRFVATSTFGARASVRRDQDGALAHAFGGLSQFWVSFAVQDEPQVYSGSHVLCDEEEQEYVSGDVLPPGVYSFVLVDPFPEQLAETAMVTAGERDRDFMRRQFQFDFRPQSTLAKKKRR
jgi:hypothetical protein